MKIINLVILLLCAKGSFSLDRNGRASVCTSASVSKRFCKDQSCQSNEIIICLGNNLELPLTCSDPYPFCSEETPGQAECVATSDKCGSDFLCTGEGIFPDPLDCKKYHNCKMSGGVLTSTSYSCRDRYVFDPDLPTMNYCRYTNNFMCTLPKCGNKQENKLFQYPFYPYNRQYVALCVPNKTPKVFRCPDGFTADLSPIPVKCNFKCRSQGLFPYPGNEKRYYECYYNSQNQLELAEGNCFDGTVFVTNQCVAQTTLSPPNNEATTTENGSSTTTEAPGSGTSTTTEASGSGPTTTKIPESGSSTTTEAPESGSSTTTENPDSGSSSSTENPDSGSSTTTENPEGRSSTTTENPDSGTSTTTENPDSGTSTTTENPENGASTTNEDENSISTDNRA